MDFIIFKVSIVVFFIFLGLHLMLLAFLKEPQAVRLTRLLFLLGLICCVWSSRFYELEIILLCLFVFSLLVLVYTLYIFRMLFEPPVYLQLIKYLDCKNGKTLEELLHEYNSKTVLDFYLKRLELSKEIKGEGQLYHLSLKGHKPLFLIDSIKQSLQDLIKTSEK